MHDFADDARRRQAGQTGQVDGAFGLPGALQDAASAGAQGEHVAGANKVFGLGLGVDGGEDGGGAVGRGNAGGDAAARLNGYRKGGAEEGRVLDVLDHLRHLQFGQTFRGQRQADQPAPVGGHEIDGLGRYLLGRHGQVALILAVFVVDQNDHTALSHVFQGFLDGVKAPLRHGVSPYLPSVAGEHAAHAAG